MFPADGAALLARLSQGMPVADAAAWYTATYHEPVDMDDFLETLTDLGFIRQDDAAPAPAPAAEVRFRRLGGALFSPPAWAVYALVLVVCAALLARQPELRPRPTSVFFTSSLLVMQVGLIVAQLPLVFLHESFHALAGRRLGLPSRLGIGRRLYFVVFETTLNGLLGVPRRKRYLPFLAGMVADTVSFCLLICAAAVDSAVNGGQLSVLGRFAVAMAFVTALRFVWQFYLFLRTDLYYVFATALGCVALHDATRAVIRNTFWRLLRVRHRMTDEEQWSARDRQVARWYAPFAATGVLVMLATAVGTAVPTLSHFVHLLADRLDHPGQPDPGFWDTLGFLVLGIAQFGMAGVVALRDRSRGKRRSSASSTPSGPATSAPSPNSAEQERT
ncbi:hypothetical protein [Streptomyces sp. NPDC006997]|uniref:hypothetical protein n=1 Tax=Streptomyces sp. NPDC006997 TaxID=3155356 RepID=UPI0033F0FCE5